MSRGDIINVFCSACGCCVGLAGCYEHDIGAQVEVRDYGVPVGFSCAGHARVYANGAEHAVGCPADHGAAGGRLLPVFAIIPEGERPPTHGPRADDVVGHDAGLDAGYGVGPLTWANHGPTERWASRRFKFTGHVFEGGHTTEASAVLWVAEGTLP